MANQINVSTTTNTVTITPQNPTSVNVGTDNTSVNVTQGSTSVVQIITQGPQGPKGETQDTGSLLETASYSSPFLTFTQGDDTSFSVEIDSTPSASHAESASNALRSVNASKSSFATTASYVESASFATTASFVITASYVEFNTGSFIITASSNDTNRVQYTKGDGSIFETTINNVSDAVSASYASSSTSASYANRATNASSSTSASYAVSASYANTSSQVILTDETIGVGTSFQMAYFPGDATGSSNFLRPSQGGAYRGFSLVQGTNPITGETSFEIRGGGTTYSAGMQFNNGPLKAAYITTFNSDLYLKAKKGTHLTGSFIHLHNAVTSSDISSSGTIQSQFLRIPQGSGGTNEASIYFGAGPSNNNGFIYDDTNKLNIGYNDSDIITIHDIAPNVEIQGNLEVISHITSSGNISASGDLISNTLTVSNSINHTGSYFTSITEVSHSGGSTYNVGTTEYVIFNKFTGSSDPGNPALIYLPPTANNEGRQLRFLTSSSLANNSKEIHIYPNTGDSSALIDDSSHFELERPFDGVTLICHSSSWYIVQRKSK